MKEFRIDMSNLLSEKKEMYLYVGLLFLSNFVSCNVNIKAPTFSYTIQSQMYIELITLKYMLI